MTRWWPWKKKPAAPRRAPVGQTQTTEVDLADLSLSELEVWLGSPFWTVLCQWLDQEMEMNRTTLLNGDIHLVASSEAGQRYRSDEGLRGGIIGMGFVRHLFPVQVREEIEAAREERLASQEEQETTPEDQDHGAE